MYAAGTGGAPDPSKAREAFAKTCTRAFSDVDGCAWLVRVPRAVAAIRIDEDVDALTPRGPTFASSWGATAAARCLVGASSDVRGTYVDVSGCSTVHVIAHRRLQPRDDSRGTRFADRDACAFS